MPAPSAAAAAEYYPAIYWYSMLKVPDKSEFPGTGPTATACRPTSGARRSGSTWSRPTAATPATQLGNKATRTIPKDFADMKLGRGLGAAHPVRAGAAQMANAIGRLDAPRALALFADWTDRIAAGELPAAKPPRPQGVERNVVITLWDWADPKAYLHDEISTDQRNPTVNANGKIYGAPEESTDFFPVLDPKAHTATAVQACRCAIPKTPSSQEQPRWRRRPTGATRRSGTARPACTIR